MKTRQKRFAEAREAFMRWHVGVTIELPDDQKWISGYAAALTDLGNELAEAKTHHDILHPNCDAELKAALSEPTSGQSEEPQP